MKIVFEFVDKDKRPLELTKEERDRAMEEILDRAMSRIGFQRKGKNYRNSKQKTVDKI